ncbi:MAG: phosphotransferase family protein [Nocardia sp.]|uniref:phosphotransferase family protein n=1 Tax=Nocardia sp. TaxID=1821 RepID=UPI00261C8FD2|nr:phosphotransferase family protein [Nocardia sp.]MCU1639985.1 phosphotransferase family protein [Nocardia sp.]
MTTHDTQSPVIDTDNVTEWLRRRIPDLGDPVEFDLITGGRSNLTFLVRDRTARTWVLRRPPAGSLLPTAHNVVREAQILTHLQGSAVPVPAVIGSCTDPTVTGSDFYVMEFIDGIVLDSAAAAAKLPASVRRAASSNIVDTLTRIHDIDCAAPGLDSFRRPGGYVERQLKRWTRQLAALPEQRAALITVRDLLEQHTPPENQIGLVHGDFRPGNLILDTEGSVRAVLDWELCTVGDVLADLGWLVAMWSPGDLVGWAPDPAEGFATPDDIIEYYHARTGRDVSGIAFYQAFALWRMACIAEGVHARFRAQAMGGQTIDLERLDTAIADMAERARLLLTHR